MNGSEAKDWIPDRRHCDSAGLTTEAEVRRTLGNGVGFRLFSEERRHLMRDHPRRNDFLDVHQLQWWSPTQLPYFLAEMGPARSGGQTRTTRKLQQVLARVRLALVGRVALSNRFRLEADVPRMSWCWPVSPCLFSALGRSLGRRVCFDDRAQPTEQGWRNKRRK